MATFAEAKCNRRTWKDALNNRNFGQAQEKLANASYTAFCCLGVACEVLGDEFDYHHATEDFIDFESEEDTGPFVGPHEERVESVLPEELRDALGLSAEQQSLLILANDSLHLSFVQIAKMVAYFDYFCDDGIFAYTGKKIGEWVVS